jgi:hypothetical protein
MMRITRLIGWIWLPIPWLWRGCFERGIVLEAWRQGWREFRGDRRVSP